MPMSGHIQWREWSEDAFARATLENKPVLLSLVTAWSDECAAMDRTTYADPGVVSLIDARFVAVRVDADRRPDVNERYNLGGWPTTSFLTNAGEVLSGGTYLSADHMSAMLSRVADAWRTHATEIRTRVAQVRDAQAGDAGRQADRDLQRPDRTAVDHFRALLIERFDSAHGGFGTSPKLPHAQAMLLALSLADDESETELSGIVELTLDRMSALWDSTNGGFYRYADAADWSRPGAEKTLQDNAALLHVFIEAAIRRRSDDSRNRAAAIVRWVKSTLAHHADGGFYNAQSGRGIDRSMYVDRNADMVSAFLRAAALFEDPWLRDFALKSLEAVILPGYSPGGGVAHSPTRDANRLLADQIHVVSTLIWAHAMTDQLPYSMLAAELMQFAIRTMWDEHTDSFRDRAAGDLSAEIGLLREPVRPFDTNCEAACVLDRLATLTGEGGHRDRALAILRSLATEYRGHDLFGASYALAIREVVDRHHPLGLELARVDWHLG